MTDINNLVRRMSAPEFEKLGYCRTHTTEEYRKEDEKHGSIHETQGVNKKYRQLNKLTSLKWFYPERIPELAILREEQKEREKKEIEKFKESQKLFSQLNSITPAIDLVTPRRPNQRLEDQMEAQTKSFKEEIRSLKEEVKKAKETNLIEKCITKEPNLKRPLFFNPPQSSNNEATEFATECIYAFKQETGLLPIKKEVWNLIRQHALSDTSPHIVSTGKNEVKIWYTIWNRDLCFRFCKSYLK